MSSASELKKIAKKQKRCQLMLSNETGIKFCDNPEKNIAICNAGLSSGLQQEVLIDEVNQISPIKDIIMIPGKSYCFLKFFNLDDSIKVYNAMHGKSKLGQNEVPLYLSYSVDVPTVINPWMESLLPPGLILLTDFINEEEELNLMNCVNWENSSSEIGKTLKHRQVKHFGYEFLYGTNNVDKNKPLEQKIPKECDILWNRLKTRETTISCSHPDQMTANKYEPGQGIPSHVDTHSAFLDPIISLSLGSDVVMEFKNIEGTVCFVFLPRRSMLVMSKESRYGYTHGITPRKFDIVPSAGGLKGLTVKKRETRISFTFRWLQDGPCNCIYNQICDTFQEQNKPIIINDGVIKSAAQLEQENVHKVYNEIGNHFSETRHSPWPKISEFLKELPLGSILADIGCGNGKYLRVNENIFKIGADRSDVLLKVCKDRGFNIFQSDCLAVPLRNESIDACISIAVIHHLASKERRIKALEEMSRILIPGGKALIYVWAKNQEANNKMSTYLLQNKQNNQNDEKVENNEIVDNLSALPVHTNRTQFKHKDILVPWKLKNKEVEDKTFLRFYHVFDENELEALCSEIKTIRIVKSYYDQGNWCVIFEKK